MTKASNLIRKTLEQQYIKMYPLEVAQYFQTQTPKDCAHYLNKQNIPAISKVFEYLPSLISAKIIEQCHSGLAAACLSNLNTAKAAEIFSCLDQKTANTIRRVMDPATFDLIRSVMSYPENSAGNIMDKRFIPFDESMTVSEAIKELKEFARIKYRVIFITDSQQVLRKYVHIQDLLFAKKSTQLKEIAKDIVVFANETDDFQTISDKISQSKVVDLPVVNYQGQLTGVIRHKILIETIQEKAASDLQKLVGVRKEERALSPVSESVKKRLPWLQINLLTAFLAAFVVGLFEGLIAKYTALAILLPVVAGQSGNTGAQALAVTMRGLFLREITTQQWWRIISKETYTGLINGLAIAITTSLAVYIWSASLGLCAIIFLSMVASMVIAGIAGAAIPIILSKAGMDPASSSSIILTTVTDVCGFFSFLGIATLLMFTL